MQALITQGVSMEDFMAALACMVRKEVEAALQQSTQKEFSSRLISPEETCNLFHPKISKVTLRSWTNQGLIKSHRIGRRVYYKHEEIQEAMQSLKRYKRSVAE